MSHSDSQRFVVSRIPSRRYRIVAAEQRESRMAMQPVFWLARVNPCVKNKLLGNSPMEIGEFRQRSF